METDQELQEWFSPEVERYLDSILEQKKNSERNPALILHEEIEARPYSVDDFERQGFLVDLIDYNYV